MRSIAIEAVIIYFFVSSLAAAAFSLRQSMIIMPFTVAEYEYDPIIIRSKKFDRGRCITWPEAMLNAKSPSDICSAIKEHIMYLEDTVDQWQDAETTLNKRTGDCEDFAILVQALCRGIGFESSVYIMNEKGSSESAHAITIGTDRGAMWMSSNGSFREILSFDEAKATMALQRYCSVDEIVLVEINSHTQREAGNAIGGSRREDALEWVDESIQWIDETPQWVDVPRWTNPRSEFSNFSLNELLQLHMQGF